MKGPWGLRYAAAILAAVGACQVLTAAQAPRDIQAIVAHVGERVADHYRRVRSLICVERSTVQPLQWNWSPDGFPRTVESELQVELAPAVGDTDADAHVVRKILRINGRAARARDETTTDSCTDPELLDEAPLDFLLPAHRREYRFTAIREGQRNGRPALAIDFRSTDPKSKPKLSEDPRGREHCFQLSGSIATAGRVWVDAATYDVLRVEQHLEGPVDIHVPWNLQRRERLPAWVTLDRDDLTLEYQRVAFDDPDEALLLPASIDEMRLWRGGFESVRRTNVYSDYRRFLTSGHIIREKEADR